MPLLEIVTNTTASNLDTVFKEATDIVVNATGKPADFVTVRVETGASIAWKGDSSIKCAHATFKSIGAINKDNNTKISEGLAHLLHEHFGVNKGNYYCEFVDMAPDNVGFKGAVFSGL